jgi:two-component system KDP operon response regulator KdpE
MMLGSGRAKERSVAGRGRQIDARPIVLMVDDEPRLTKLAALTLKAEGFRVVTAGGGREALDIVGRVHPDLVVLDVSMSDMGGLEVLGVLREWHPVPVILTSDRSSMEDLAFGLDCGADDYVWKPFYPRELAARVRAVLRRSHRGSRAAKRLQIGRSEVDLGGRTLTRDGERIPLSRTEWALLRELAEHAGCVMTHEELLTVVLGAEFRDDPGQLRLWVARLRRKLGTPPREKGPIRTFPGIGYALDLDGSLSDSRGATGGDEADSVLPRTG